MLLEQRPRKQWLLGTWSVVLAPHPPHMMTDDLFVGPQWGNTALICAARNGRKECLVILLDAGADKNAVGKVNGIGFVPLHSPHSLPHHELSGWVHGPDVGSLGWSRGVRSGVGRVWGRQKHQGQLWEVGP